MSILCKSCSWKDSECFRATISGTRNGQAQRPLLSNELLFLIAFSPTTGGDSQSISCLCLTSHRLLAIAQPALYTNIQIASLPQDPLKLMTKLLLTLLEPPDLAKATQKLSCINDYCVQYGRLNSRNEDALYPYLTKEEFQLFEKSLAVALLSRLPNLKHLCYTAELGSSYPLLRHICDLQRDTCALSKLETFHL